MEITASDLAALLADSPPTLVDVREPWETTLAPFPNALLIPLGQLPHRAQSELPPGPMITICHHGVRSLQAAYLLRSLGFTDVRSLRGGIDAWSRTVDPSLPRY